MGACARSIKPALKLRGLLGSTINPSSRDHETSTQIGLKILAERSRGARPLPLCFPFIGFSNSGKGGRGS